MSNIFLRGVTWDHHRGYGPLDASVAVYKEMAGIDVKWDRRSLKDFGDASLEVLAKEYDLIIMDHPHCGTASSTRCILPLEKILKHKELAMTASNSVGPSFNSYNYHSHQWALPIDAACQVSCRRPDLLSEDKLPHSWNGVINLAESLKSKGQFVGAALCPTDCNCIFLTLCAQFGDPIQEDKFTTVATATEALRVLYKLHEVCHPDSTTWNPVRLYDYMSTHEDVVYSPLGFGYTNYSRRGYSNKQLAFGPIPGHYNAILGGAGIAVSSSCQFPNEAAMYAAWLCNEQFQSTGYVHAGGQPAHHSAWTNEAANELTGEFFMKTRSTIESAYVRPRNLRWPLFQEKLGDIIHKGLVKNKDIVQTWATILTTYDNIYSS